MNKKIKFGCALLLSGMVLAGTTGCSIVGTETTETEPYVESVSALVKEPNVEIEKINGEKLVIADGTKEITKDSIGDKTLISIEIPDSVKSIEEDAIDKNTIIICNDNSTAYEYASENGYWYYLTYETLDDNNDKVTLTALYSDENVMITDEMPCNSKGILHTLDGEIKKQDAETIISYVNGLVENIKEGKPYIAFSRGYGIDDLELTAKDDTADIGLLSQAKSSLRKLFVGNAEDGEFCKTADAVEYGEDNSQAFNIGTIPYSASYDNDDTFSAYCAEADVINKININFGTANSSELIDGVFGVIPAHNRDEINAEFDKLSEFVEISDDWTVEYKDCSLYVMCDRTTDKAETLELTRSAYITATAKGVGSFEYLGEFEITFRFNDNYSISFDWTAPEE